MAPDSSEAQEALGLLLLEQRKREEATECFRRVLRMNPTSARAYILLADTLQQQGLSDLARELVDKALALDPESGPAHCLLGFARLDLGDFDLATSSFERSISLLRTQAEAYLGLVTSRKITEADRALVDQMTGLLEDPGLTAADKAQMHAALGKAFDDLGQYELAVAHVDEGNRIALGLEGNTRPPGSKEGVSAYIAKTIEIFSADFYRKHRDSGLDSESPIFVVGLPRSGTTLLEQILSCHSGIAAGGEMPFWNDIGDQTPGRLIGLASNRAGARAAAEEYLRRTRLMDPEARFVIDKYNDNFMNVGFLHLVFPNARFIHCRRNPLDNCVSLYMTPFRKKSPLFCEREEILEYYRQCTSLMAHWREVLPPNRFLEVDYEETVADREAVTRRAIAFCDLEWEDACLRHEENKRTINTPSIWQARQPLYRTSVERWRRYEPWLGAFRKLIPNDG